MTKDDDFSEYARARWQTLLRSALFLGCSGQEAEDLAQTTLLRAYVAWAKVERATNRDAYVSRILVNAHRDSHRRHWWDEKPTAQLPDTEEPDESVGVDGADAIQRALAQLTPVQREVVVLRFYLQLSERETADTLRIPPGTVKSRLSSALHQLSTDLNLADLRNGGTQ
ncbi:MAG: sigE [Nocardioides sp.]|nr:sigE [Nocardioides sp.]